MLLQSLAEGRWVSSDGLAAPIASAVTGEPVATIASGGLDYAAMAAYARRVGGPALRALTFHQRASMLKALGSYLTDHKEALYRLSTETGATKADSWIDIDGGIGTLFVYASKGKRELPNETFLIDGAYEGLSKNNTFGGRHIMTPVQGVAVHINAFNFPCWGLLEKLAPTILAGVPLITKPATATAYLAEALVKLIAQSNILPAGAVQLVVGSLGDLVDHLTCQDVVSFTGSAATSEKLQAHPMIVRNAVRFIAERDSLNASILGPDAAPGTPEFDLFIKEVAKEMTAKAGQKCTAIRRAIVPDSHMDAVIAALRDRLSKVTVGHPGLETTRMGALVSQAQRADVRDKITALQSEADIVFGDLEGFTVDGADKIKGAFLPPVLLHCGNPDRARLVHEIEPFGPVSTVMGYRDVDHAVALANRGEGSLVASLFTYDPEVARAVVFGSGAYHGRLAMIDRDSAKESTGHGSPMPHMIHGGPGRAGGGEEMGGIRGVMHYMQRTALQGSPKLLSQVMKAWIKGAPEITKAEHPFRYIFEELDVGQTFHSTEREVTLADIEHFAHFTGDTFYAHMDEEATKGHPFFPGRVAHGYLLLSFAAGLFVEPARGPVLANYGLDNLRFLKPIQPGERIKVRLTVQQKAPRNQDYGEVRWNVEITNEADETAATYELLTMNALRGSAFDA